ncbi:transcription factor-like 5 protein [Cheilinus undulatus]|uniref:transcription factor-like 5 protein n=1 Tax=Cheilinus undulatus TaxID=241271 RepID=UPI001BD45CAE|nr:transcription factor-like 5 protein [Cheilinus undulatus]
MSLFSSCQTIHSSPSYKEHTCDCAGVSQGGCLTHDQGQMLGPELVQMSEVEYAHLQHLFQSQMETQAAPPDSPDASSPPAAVIVKDAPGSEVISPYTSQVMDLSTSSEDHNLVMPGEKTPASFGEVPGFVLARMRGDDVLTEPRTNNSKSAQKRPKSSARVCLETRFNTISSDTPRRQDVQSAVLSNSLTILQQSAESQEAGIHPQMQKWMKTDRAKPFDLAGPIVGGVFNPVTNMCEQVIGSLPYMIDSHQGYIIPKNLSYIFRPDRVVQTAHRTTGRSSAEKQQLVNSESNLITSAASRKNSSTPCLKPKKSAKTVPASAVGSGGGTRKKKRLYISPSKRRERHNMKERERRKMIRLCCDELNMLVPFCNSDSDKVTTLQWTTAFLRYIDKTYGDTFKEEFKTVFRDEKGLFPKSCLVSNQELMRQEMDEILTIPLAAEQ